MVIFCCPHGPGKVFFHTAPDDAVVAERGARGRQGGKLPNALAVILQGVEIIRPDDIFFRSIKSSCVSDDEEIFFFLEKGDVARRMAGSIMSGPYDPRS